LSVSLPVQIIYRIVSYIAKLQVKGKRQNTTNAK